FCLLGRAAALRGRHRSPGSRPGWFRVSVSAKLAGPTFGPAPGRTSISEGERAMLKEFKEFAMRGNVLDMAVGIIIGAAFGKIVSSLVDDIIMPPIGRVLGQVDFSNLFINLGSTTYPTIAAAKAAGQPTLNYGLFLNTMINFLIVAFAIFL